MKPWLRRGLWGVVALAAAGAVALASRPTPVPVESAAVTRGPLRVSVQVDGRTRVRQRYTVMAPTAGNLSRIELRRAVGLPILPGGSAAPTSAAPGEPR